MVYPILFIAIYSSKYNLLIWDWGNTFFVWLHKNFDLFFLSYKEWITIIICNNCFLKKNVEIFSITLYTKELYTKKSSPQ